MRPRPTWSSGDRVRLPKPHACGASDWEITRVGADVGLRCRSCGRHVRLPRAEFDRRAVSLPPEPAPLPI